MTQDNTHNIAQQQLQQQNQHSNNITHECEPTTTCGATNYIDRPTKHDIAHTI